MTNPTTPFSWQMPTSTDLVTDLPADFETFGQAVATSMADLLGGTTGQVLSKASNTDMDFTWVAQDDSNAIQNAIVDAKGDIITATAADTPARLAVGTNGQTLVADSTASTGLKWATPASGSTFVGCSLWQSGNVSAPNVTETIMTFDSELFDTDAFHSTSTNTGRITIPTGKGGYYLVTGMIVFLASSGGMRSVALFKNGGATSLTDNALPNSASQANDAPWFSYIGNFAAGDYLEIKGYQNSGSALNMRGGAYYTRFSVSYIGA